MSNFSLPVRVSLSLSLWLSLNCLSLSMSIWLSLNCLSMSVWLSLICLSLSMSVWLSINRLSCVLNASSNYDYPHHQRYKNYRLKLVICLHSRASVFLLVVVYLLPAKKQMILFLVVLFLGPLICLVELALLRLTVLQHLSVSAIEEVSSSFIFNALSFPFDVTHLPICYLFHLCLSLLLVQFISLKDTKP